MPEYAGYRTEYSIGPNAAGPHSGHILTFAKPHFWILSGFCGFCSIGLQYLYKCLFEALSIYPSI